VSQLQGTAWSGTCKTSYGFVQPPPAYGFAEQCIPNGHFLTYTAQLSVYLSAEDYTDGETLVVGTGSVTVNGVTYITKVQHYYYDQKEYYPDLTDDTSLGPGFIQWTRGGKRPFLNCFYAEVNNQVLTTVTAIADGQQPFSKNELVGRCPSVPVSTALYCNQLQVGLYAGQLNSTVVCTYRQTNGGVSATPRSSGNPGPTLTSTHTSKSHTSGVPPQMLPISLFGLVVCLSLHLVALI